MRFNSAFKGLIVYGVFKNDGRMKVNNKVERMWKKESWLN
jgi:hypothetical protein